MTEHNIHDMTPDEIHAANKIMEDEKICINNEFTDSFLTLLNSNLTAMGVTKGMMHTLDMYLHGQDATTRDIITNIIITNYIIGKPAQAKQFMEYISSQTDRQLQSNFQHIKDKVDNI